MFNRFHSTFLIYLPSIIRVCKYLNINLSNFFNGIKSHLDKNEIVEEIKNKNDDDHLGSGSINIWGKNKVKRNRSSSQKEGNVVKTRKSQLDREKLVKEFDTLHCSIEEDWREWFKSTSKALFEQSPSYALYYCHSVSDFYSPLLTELYNYAFISCWRHLNDYNKISVINYLKDALNNNNTPNEILLTILNLSEFIKREENYDFIDLTKLGEIAHQCQALAKALYYQDNNFRNNNDFNSLEELISLYYELKLNDAATGILIMARKSSKITHVEDWYVKLQKWKEALEFYKVQDSKLNPDIINKKFICLDGLCDWENLLDLADTDIDPNYNEETLKKHSPILSKASMNLGMWDKMKYYITFMSDNHDDIVYEKNFFSAVLAIKEEKYDDALNFIDE